MNFLSQNLHECGTAKCGFSSVWIISFFQGRIAVYFMFYNIYIKYNKHINTRILKAFSATLNWLRYGDHTWGVAKTSTPPVPIGSSGCSKVARPTPVSAIFLYYLHLWYKKHIQKTNISRALGFPNSEFYNINIIFSEIRYNRH